MFIYGTIFDCHMKINLTVPLKRFLKITALIYIYQLAKFGDLISCGTNTHHDITDLVNQGWFKIQKLANLENET